MSTDLLEQLAEYGADHRARQAPVERHEILARVRDLTVADEEPPVEQHAVRPQFLLAAAAAVVTLLVTGLVLVVAGRDSSDPTDDPDSDFIRGTEPSTPVTAPPPTVSTTTSTTSPASPEEETSAPAVEVPSIAATALTGEPTAVAAATVHDQTRLVALGAWDDGFLNISVVGGVPMAAELSDEMFARLPAEVQEAYPEQLTGTLNDVRIRLEEDGLAELVYAAMEADPELEAAVLGGPVTPVELRAEFTTNGDVWTPIEISAPAMVDIEDVFFVGNRLVAIGTPPNTPDAVPFKTMVVASTLDLVEWSVQTVPDVVETLAEVSIAANDIGWVAHIEPDLFDLDPNGGMGGPGTGYDVGEGPPLTWAAPWNGTPTVLDGALGEEGVTVTAVQEGFLAQHDAIEFSPDGLRWEPVAGAPEGVRIDAALPIGDGHSAVFAFADSCHVEIYLVDQQGQEWERIALDIEGAGAGLLPSSNSFMGPTSQIGARSLHSTAVIIDDKRGGTVDSAIGDLYVAERDGLRLDLAYCAYGYGAYNAFSGQRYELVDTDSGAVLVSEDVDTFEHLIHDNGSVTVFDPTTGDELVTFDGDDVEGQDFGYTAKETWLVTTVDGTSWVVDELPADWVQFGTKAARNADTVLVGLGEEWSRYQLSDS